MLTAPQLVPLSKKIKAIVLILHGFGASGDDLISLADQWQSKLPDTLFIAPHAPHRMEFGYGGYQWFGLPNLEYETLLKGIVPALTDLHLYIDTLLEKYQISEDKLAIVGFSQGGMMALGVGLTRRKPMAAVISYSGAFVLPPHMPVSSYPPVLLVHGNLDQVVPVFYHQLSEDELKRRGVSVTSLLCQNVGHGIDQKGIDTGGSFLYQHLGSPDKE